MLTGMNLEELLATAERQKSLGVTGQLRQQASSDIVVPVIGQGGLDEIQA